MIRVPTRQEVYRTLRRIAGQEIESIGPVELQATSSTGVAKGIVPAAYVSGNPQIQRAHETSATLGSKTYRVAAPISNRNGALAASDSIEYGFDGDGNKVVLGKIKDVSGIVVDSDYLMGLRPVAPGNTLLTLTGGNHDAEISTTSATYVDTANKFHVTRPGLYRLKVELARSGGTTRARAIRKLKDGTVVVLTAEVTQATLTHPTFGAVQSLDFTTPVDWGDVVYFQLANDSGPAQTGYAQNCRLYYQDATASIAPYDAAI